MAVSWIESTSDDELADYLPQLVQVNSLVYTHTGNQFVGDSECFSHPISLSMFFWLSQALKFECHLKNALVMFLLSRAQGNVSIAHYLYW